MRQKVNPFKYVRETFVDIYEFLIHVVTPQSSFAGKYANSEIEVEWKWWGLYSRARDFRGLRSFEVKHTGSTTFEYPQALLIRGLFRQYFLFRAKDSSGVALSKLMNYREQKKQEAIAQGLTGMIIGFTTSSGSPADAFKEVHEVEMKQRRIPAGLQYMSMHIYPYDLKPEERSEEVWGYFVNAVMKSLLACLKEDPNPNAVKARYTLRWAMRYLNYKLD